MSMRRRLDLRKRGFTLLEMSVVLVILSLVAAGGMMALSAQTRNSQAAVTGSRLDAIEAALKAFVTLSGYEPCAASTLITLDDTNTTDDVAYGVSTSCAQLATIPANHVEDAGTYDIRPSGGSANGADDIRMGSVPVRALGLPDNYMFDGWGNRFTYITIKSMSRDKTTAAAYLPPASLTTGVLKITDAAGNQIPDAAVKTITPYVVISHGPLGHGAIPRLGGTFASCSATWLESKNCDLDEVFVDTRYNDSTATPANYFTNQIRWKSSSLLFQAPPPPTPVVYVPVAVSDYDDLYVDRFGKLWAAGSNQYGDFGNNTTTASSTIVRGAPTIPSFQYLTAGVNDACGIDQFSKLYCWGVNGSGQLGTGNTTSYSLPQAIATGFTWQQVVTNQTNTCAITLAGTLYCDGDNTDYQLGNNTNTASKTLIQVGTDATWTSVATGDGGAFVCGVDNGLGYCWGLGNLNAGHNGSWLGQTSSVASYVKVPTQIGGTVTNWQTIQAGGRLSDLNACGITTANALYCWGNNSAGSVGDGTTTDRYTPTSISGTWASVALNSSVNSVCGIKTGGTLWCWGNNQYGQLGTGDTTTRTSPTQIGTATDWTAVSGAYEHTCGLRSGKTLYCWGTNNTHEFGDGGSDSGSNAPEKILTSFPFK